MVAVPLVIILHCLLEALVEGDCLNILFVGQQVLEEEMLFCF